MHVISSIEAPAIIAEISGANVAANRPKSSRYAAAMTEHSLASATEFHFDESLTFSLLKNDAALFTSGHC
ncbi:MAG: hypothetical protein JXA41_05405 [Deltaproteobacteria bacterium]|nr:hypothetical protein [Deltaproteobacteria bacterium]